MWWLAPTAIALGGAFIGSIVNNATDKSPVSVTPESNVWSGFGGAKIIMYAAGGLGLWWLYKKAKKG